MRGRTCHWLWATLVLVGVSPAQEPESLPVSAVAGFRGVAASSGVVPIAVAVEAGDSLVSGRVSAASLIDEYGRALHDTTLRLNVPAGGRQRYWLTVWPSRSLPQVSLDLALRDGTRSKLNLELERTADPILLAVGADPAGARLLNGRLVGGPLPPLPGQSEPPHSLPAWRVVELQPEELPPIPAAYEGVAAIALTDDTITSDAPEALAAIANWVQAGGRLFLTAGPRSAGLWQAEPLVDLLPVAAPASGTIAGGTLTEALRHFGPLGSAAAAAGYGIATLTAQPGRLVRLSANGQPLVVTGQAGAGEVTVVGLAPGEAPLRGWLGLVEFWGWLLRDAVAAPPLDAPAWGFLGREAASIPGVRPPSPWLIGGFLLVYLLTLTVFQARLLKRLGRREWSWFTTPLIAVAFSLIAYGLGVQVKGRESRLRSVSLVQSRAGAEVGQASTAVAIFSTQRQTVDLGFGPDVRRLAELDVRSLFQFYGGQEAPAGDRRFTVHQQGGSLALPRFELRVWDMRGLGLRHTVGLDGSIAVEATVHGQQCRGTVTNRLRHDLQQAVVVIAGHALELGNLAPGEQKDFTTTGSDQSDPAATLLSALTLPQLPGFEPDRLMEAVGSLLGLTGGWSPDDEPDGSRGLLAEPAVWGWLVGRPGPVPPPHQHYQQDTLELLRIAFEPRFDSPGLLTLRAIPLGSTTSSGGTMTFGGSSAWPGVIRFDLPPGLAPARLRRLTLCADVGSGALYLLRPGQERWTPLHDPTSEASLQATVADSDGSVEQPPSNFTNWRCQWSSDSPGQWVNSAGSVHLAARSVGANNWDRGSLDNLTMVAEVAP